MSTYCCPICKAPLEDEGKSLYCKRRHCFDKAKSGYVNLLPANKAHSKAPGDNKLMVEGRSAFLNRGYYQPLREALCKAVLASAESAEKPLTLLDAGCGEGYYTAGIAETLSCADIPTAVVGVDISKAALNAAAKRTKKALFAVASVFSLPLLDNSCQLVTEVFAPFCREEFFRVLKPEGKMILVIPAKDHLWELKQAVYEQPYENEVKPYKLEGFLLENRTEIRDRIFLGNGEDIRNLFTMTPYYYKTSREDTERLLSLETLTTTISFELLTYQKKG